MIEFATRTHVPGLRGEEITDFFASCDDAAYQRWWPGTHLQFHTVSRKPGYVGSLVYMDEYIGNRRIRSHADVLEFVSGRRLVVQLRHFVRLPVSLVIKLSDNAEGVTVSHTIRAGFGGLGHLLDPLLRVWFSDSYRRAMDEHVRTEFPLLRDNIVRPARAE